MTSDASGSSKKRKLEDLISSVPPPPRRKVKGKEAAPAAKALAEEDRDSSSGSDSDSDSSDAPSHIDVAFTFVAPSAIDFHALKALLSQLFHTHAPSMPIGEIVDGIFARGGVQEEDGRDNDKELEPAVGTVIKQDTGEEEEAQGEVYGVMSAFELKAHKSPSSRLERATTHLHNYVLKQLPAASPLRPLLTSATPPLLLLHERLINMPAAVAPVLYRLTLDEMRSAEKKTPSHVLLFSRIFALSALHEDVEGARGGATTKKKSKGAAATDDDQSDIGLFKPEDSIFAKHALHAHTFAFPAPPSANSWSEAPLSGRLLLLKWDAFQAALKEVEREFDAGTGGAAS